MDRAPRLSSRLCLAVVGTLTAAVLAGASCSGPTASTISPPPRRELRPIEAAALGAPDLRLLILTDLDGYLEPCGCTSRPLGGIDRMASEVARQRGDGVPTLLVAAGDLLFEPPSPSDVAHAGAEAQEIWKAELLTTILDRVGLAGATLGEADLRFGSDTLFDVARRAHAPLLAAGVQLRLEVARDPAQAPPPPGATTSDSPQFTQDPADPTLRALRAGTIVTAGAVRVGLIGLSDLASGAAGAIGPDDLVATARSEAARLRGEGAELVVALVRAPRRTTRRIAAQVEGLDFVVEGGVDEEEPHLPATTDHAAILHAGRHGQRLLVVDVHRGEAGSGWTDVGAWTREVERARLVAQADELRERIAQWEVDPSATASDVAEQRARLAELERDAEALAAAPTTRGGAFSASVVEIAPDHARDPAITALVTSYDERVNEHNRVAFEDWLPAPPAEGQPRYVGAATCGGCHTSEFAWWQTTQHGHAYQTLVERHKEFNLSCVGCHVTGYARPGGSTVSHTGVLQNVGCESCHGPASQHVEAPGTAAVNVRRSPPEDTCRGCHTPEHSDRFDFPTYRARMVVPGHGLPRTPASEAHR